MLNIIDDIITIDIEKTAKREKEAEKLKRNIWG